MATKSTLNSTGFKAFLSTQFLGAFNDNAFKLTILFVARNVLKDSSSFITLANALFTLPFIVFSAYAGYVADRVSKKTMMVWIKVAEIVIMFLGGIALFSGNLHAMVFVLFLMATQSALFGPAKYGILPEILPDEELSRANGRLQLWTFMAIIAGTAVGGPLFNFFNEGLRITKSTVIGFDNKIYLVSLDPKIRSLDKKASPRQHGADVHVLFLWPMEPAHGPPQGVAEGLLVRPQGGQDHAPGGRGRSREL